MASKNIELDMLKLELKEMEYQSRFSGTVNTDDLDDEEWFTPHTDGTYEKQKAASRSKQTISPQVEAIQQKIKVMEQQLTQTTAVSEENEQELVRSTEDLEENNLKLEEPEEKINLMEDNLEQSMERY